MKKRVLVKLSGEALSNKEKGLSIDPQVIKDIAIQFKEMQKDGFEIAVVCGGGNFWRGAAAEKNGIPRNRADYIGMLATIMNGLALQSGLEQEGLKARIQSSLNVDAKVAENYINEVAKAKLSSGEIVIFAGGTGRPYFTTDTAAALVASEVEADTILMGKNGVDGIYDSDPNTNPDAKRYDELSYDDLIAKGLQVMDTTAATMASNNGLELIVFNMTEDKAIVRASKGEITLSRVKK